MWGRNTCSSQHQKKINGLTPPSPRGQKSRITTLENQRQGTHVQTDGGRKRPTKTEEAQESETPQGGPICNTRYPGRICG